MTKIKTLTANRGEWSEFYAFIKLMADGKVYGADEKLKILDSIFYPIVKVIRAEASRPEFVYDIKEGEDKVIVYDTDGNPAGEVKRLILKKHALDIFNKIKSNQNGTFAIPEIAELMKSLNCTVIKAGSRDKTDITLLIHDLTVNHEQKVGFSIKSRLGGNPTLLNASDHTRFIYKAKGITEEQARDANNISTKGKVLDRIAYLYDKGGSLEFVKTESEILKRNLRRIDTSMDRIMAEVLKYSYIANKKDVSDIISDPKFSSLLADLDLTKEDYEFKIKNLLWASALGMSPGKTWSGYDTVYGGYLIVREDGEVVCYHVYNQDQFKDYLLNSVFLESPSSTRHKYGNFRFEPDGIYFDLSLQIRFR